MMIYEIKLKKDYDFILSIPNNKKSYHTSHRSSSAFLRLKYTNIIPGDDIL